MSSVTTNLVFGVPHLPVYRFTIDEYHRMIAAGILDEDDNVELLEGLIVPKMTRNPPHDVALQLLQEVISAWLPKGWSTRGQSALTTSDSEPEPDGAIIRGQAREYKKRPSRPRRRRHCYRDR